MLQNYYSTSAFPKLRSEEGWGAVKKSRNKKNIMDF